MPESSSCPDTNTHSPAPASVSVPKWGSFEPFPFQNLEVPGPLLFLSEHGGRSLKLTLISI